MHSPGFTTLFPLVLCALIACPCSADEDNKLKLKNFFSAAQYDVQCFDLVGDPKTNAFAIRIQAWLQANFEVAKDLMKENEGRPLPYHETMAAHGITEADYADFVKNSKTALQVKDVGEPLSYAVVLESDRVRFVPKAGEGAYDDLDPGTIPYAANLLLTSSRFDLTNTKLELLEADIGEAKWKTGESDLLGTFRGFEWRLEDERILDFKDLPEGEVVTNVIVVMYYSAKQRKSYGKYSVAIADRDGIQTNAQVNFWLAVRPASR